MATINDLFPSLLELPKDEGLEFIKSIRTLRRIPPEVKKSKAKTRPKKESMLSIDSLLSKLGDIDTDALIKILEGGR